jgi:hypothetical protein
VWSTRGSTGFADQIGSPDLEEYYKQPNVLFEEFLTSGTDGNAPTITGLHPFGFQPGVISFFFDFDQADLLFPSWLLGRDPTGPGYAQFFTQNQGNFIGPFYVPGAGQFVYSFGSVNRAPGGIEGAPAAGPGAGPEGENQCVDEFFAGQNYANSDACTQ